jgi:peptidylprolyl isomerase
VPSNQQRRETERRRLQRQLEQRRAREANRKRFTLIASIVSTLVVIAGIVVAVVLATGGSDDSGDKSAQSGGNPSTASSAASSPAASPSTAAPGTPPAPTAPCNAPTPGPTATFRGVTVKQATNLKREPKVTSQGDAAPGNILCQDLVVGSGKAASPSSTVTVQYTGVLYTNGKQFDSSWSRGQTAQFSLAQVVPGFTEGIGGAGKVEPMKVGGRRIMILPPALGYGSQANGSIPANSSLVFVVDLKSIDG